MTRRDEPDRARRGPLASRVAVVREALHALFTRTREFASRRRIAREADDEIRFHVDAEIAHNIAQGMSPGEARRAALIAFGGVERYREATRDARGFVRLEALVRDSRMAVRRLRRAPMFTLGVITTLAVGLGAATAIGALVYGVMLRPLPYPDPDRIVRITVRTPGLGISATTLSAGLFAYVKESAHSFSVLAGSAENEGIAITEGDAPERVTGAMVTSDVFRLLGTRVVVGRLLRDEDDNDARPFDSPVLISFELWQRRFGGDPHIAEKTIELNRRPRRIVGVLPAGFAYPSRRSAIYYPQRITDTRAGLGSRHLDVDARLAPRVTVAQAQRELELLFAHIRDRFPELSAEQVARAGLSVKVEPLRAGLVAPVEAELTLLAIMVGALLFIAVANVSTLSLLRAQRLRGEVAVSRALGASHATIMQRFVVEGVVVALAGGLLALPITAFALTIRFGLTDAQLPRLQDVELTPVVALALLALSLFVGVALGILGAARAGSAGDVGSPDAMKGETRTTQGRGWRRAQEGLVAAQIALAMTLLLAAGLMGTSFVNLRRIDLGFVPTSASKFSIALPFSAYPTFQRTAAFDLAVMDALRHVPGVTDVGAAMQFPSMPQLLYSNPRFEATRANGTTSQSLVTANVVTEGFFRAMRLPIKRGRAFARGDLLSSTPGVVLGAALARELFGDEDPIGRTVKMVSTRPYPPYRVVGVSGDVFSDRVTEGPLRVIYFPLLGDLPPTSKETEDRIPYMPAGMHFVIRSERPFAELVPAFRRAVASVDPRVPVWDVRKLDDVVAETMLRTRLTMVLLVLAAGATLLLAGIGLYSAIAYAVSGRQREFAVRLAIGATPAAISRMVVREGVIVATVGVAAGVLLSQAGLRVLRHLLFEASGAMAPMHAAAIVIVLGCTAIATMAPARRAGRANPLTALQGGFPRA